MPIKPKEITAKIIDKKVISPRVVEVTLSPVSETSFKFIPGQFVNIEVGKNKYRSYSLCSDPKNVKEFRIIASIDYEGLGSNFIKNSKVGNELKLIGPSGRFQLKKPTSSEIVFLVTGTGISVFISMLYALLNKKSELKIRLYFGVRNQDEILYLDLLSKFKKDLSDFDFTIYVSQPIKQCEYKKGRITNNYKINSPQNTHVYLCGHPSMIDENLQLLRGMGVKEQNTYYEKFTYSKKYKHNKKS